jgi:hypothetical protein
MYVWIWRHLPGTLALKTLQVLLLVLVISGLLLFVIFPWVEPHLGLNDPAVSGGGGHSGSTGSGGAVH